MLVLIEVLYFIGYEMSKNTELIFVGGRPGWASLCQDCFNIRHLDRKI